MGKRRIICVFITFILVLSVCSGAYALNAGGLTYEVNNGEVTITGCDYNATAVYIPAAIDGKPVTGINRVCLSSENLEKIEVDENNKYLSSYDGVLYNKDKTELIRCPQKKAEVLIPDGVKTICPEAFSFCSNLKNVSIPDTVESIGYYAFDTCSGLTEIIIPDSVKVIEQSAFELCTNITEIELGSSLERIETGAFNTCKVIDLTIPDSVTYIGRSALPLKFENTLPDGENYLGKVFYKYKGEMPENTNIIIKDGTKGIAGDAFRDCSNLTSVAIPESVTQIAEWAFHGCSNLNSIKLPSRITSIDRYAFSSCDSLTEIQIPDGVTEIGSEAFSGCSSLESVTVPDSVYSIGADAFSETKWLENQGEGVIYAGKVVIGYNGEIYGETDITITEGTKGIADNAFDDYYFNGFPEIVIPDSVEYIGLNAFRTANSMSVVKLTIKNPNAVIEKMYFLENATITSDPGSTAQKYAYDNGYTWIPLSLVMGDLDLDGKVEVEDARAALRNAVQLQTLDEYAVQCADIDGNGIVGVDDARTILRKAVGLEK